MNKKIKVLFLSSWFPNRIYPANGDFVERHAQAVALYNEVAVLYVQADSGMKKTRFEFHEKDTGIYQLIIYFKKIDIPIFSKAINGIIYLYSYFHGYKIISKKFGKPDIIHASVIYPIIIIAYLLKLIFRIPFVITEHWTIYLSDKIPSKKISRFLAHKAGKLMPVSHDLEKALLKHGFFGNYRVVPNVVDISRFTLKKSSPDPFKILHVSSMKEEQKNISGIIRTAARLAKLRENFRIDFVGSYSSEQLEKSKETGLLNRFVYFHGEKNHDEIPAFMEQADIFLLFSNYENQPCVIAEAFSCGLPVISTKVGGIHEHVSEKTGILLEAGNENALLDRYINLMENYSKFNNDFIHRYAAENFSMEKVGKEFDDIYNEVLNTHSVK